MTLRGFPPPTAPSAHASPPSIGATTGFISYARPDEGVVATLHADLEQTGRDVWFDRDLQGGQQWWDIILEQIRSADLFVFALSPDSVTSRACRSEIAYAVALGKPILPVMVRDTNIQLAPDPIGSTNIVDYRHRTPDSATKLTVAVLQTPIGAGPLPDPLPTPPPAPITDLEPLRLRLAAPQLDFAEQQGLVADLKQLVSTTDQHQTLRELAEQFLARGDLVVSVHKELTALISTIPVATASDMFDTRQSAPKLRTLDELDPDTRDLLRSLATHIDNDHFTPIIGRGMTNSLLGPMGLLADQWARNFGSPTKMRRRTDLPQAAQFVEVMNNVDTLRSALTKDLRSHILEFHGDEVDNSAATEFSQLLTAAWKAQRARTDHDPHMVLAGLPCRIYVTAHPWGLMADALRECGKDPVVELCRWRPDVYEWPESIFDTDPTYNPTVERPLVFHVFGTVDTPDSLVLSADDYLDFLISVTADPALIPRSVGRSLADSALLLLGFGLEEMDVRVLLRTLVSREGGRKLNKYSHVGAQSHFRPGADGLTREQRYLERYFGKFRDPSIDIFWGTVDEFAAGLAELRGAGR